ncbi:MAG: hypothetical protein INR65_05655 [Gluconacetobacter diazotrophicus]|nr:hypothetical protein [Gluconacetobacter diazotrophicus]
MSASTATRFLLPTLGLAALLGSGVVPAAAQDATRPAGSVSSGQVAAGVAKPENAPHPRSGVGPGHPAPAHHVTQPSSKLKDDPAQVKEQVAPVPEKPGHAPG